MAKSPGGVKLNELLVSLKQQNMELPEQFQSQIAAAKVPAATGPSQPSKTNKTIATVAAGAPLPQKKAKKIAKGKKFAYHLLKGIFGKDIIRSLTPKEPTREQEQSVYGKSPSSSRNSDIQQIKADVSEIKHMLVHGVKTPSKRKDIAKRFGKGMIVGAFGRFGEAMLARYNKYHAKKAALQAITKIAKPAVQDPVTKIPKVEVAPAIDQAMLQAKAEHTAIPVAPGSGDQQKAESAKEHTEQEHDKAEQRSRLDKILQMLKDMKKGGGLGAIVMLIIAALWKKLHPVWMFIRKGVKLITKAVLFVKGVLLKAWNAIKWVAGKLGELWNKIVKFFSGAAEEAGEVAGVAGKAGAATGEAAAATGKAAAATGEAAAATGKAAAATGEAAEVAGAAGTLTKVGKLARLGKGLGVVGAAVDVGMGLNDLAHGKEQTELHGSDYISPMRLGMYTGHKINQGVAAMTGGEDLSEMASRGVDKILGTNQPQLATGTAHGVITRPKLQSVAPRNVAALKQATDDKEEMDNETDNDTSGEPNVVVAPVMHTSSVVPTAPAPSSGMGIITTRNQETSVNRLSSMLWDDPSSYTSIAR